MGGVKNIWGSNIYHYINTFHYFFSLKTQKSEMFLLRISLGNLNASVVACWYPNFRTEF